MALTATKLFDTYGGGQQCRAYVISAAATDDATTTINPPSGTATSAIIPKFVQVTPVAGAGTTSTIVTGVVFGADINLTTGVVTISRGAVAGGAISVSTSTGIARVLIWDDLP